MFKMKKNKITRDNITSHLIEYQLNIIDKTTDSIKTDDKWYDNNTMNFEQFEQFKNYTIPLLQKVFKFNKNKANKTFNWFVINYGLKIKK